MFYYKTLSNILETRENWTITPMCPSSSFKDYQQQNHTHLKNLGIRLLKWYSDTLPFLGTEPDWNRADSRKIPFHSGKVYYLSLKPRILKWLILAINAHKYQSAFSGTMWSVVYLSSLVFPPWLKSWWLSAFLTQTVIYRKNMLTFK